MRETRIRIGVWNFAGLPIRHHKNRKPFRGLGIRPYLQTLIHTPATHTQTFRFLVRPVSEGETRYVY